VTRKAADIFAERSAEDLDPDVLIADGIFWPRTHLLAADAW